MTEAEPESKAQSKPETRARVFEEPWNASWLWFAISESKPEVSNHMRQAATSEGYATVSQTL